MPYIIGTAGHIDHGKTSLIKALTGKDTDRLKEEKERGISIDLGFAHLALPDGSEAGIVDVPGHERFIRNMLAGAHGIDLVLFTVAADDGVMPQTEEHLDIVHLLGVRKALFVITKVDLVSEARVREVEEEIEILTFETALEGSPVVHFSAVSEAGLEQVRGGIHDLLGGIDRPAPSGFFRLPWTGCSCSRATGSSSPAPAWPAKCAPATTSTRCPAARSSACAASRCTASRWSRRAGASAWP